MRNMVAALILTDLMAGASLADVLYLKDGSVLKGSYVGYGNDKIIFETGGNRLEFRPDQTFPVVVPRHGRRPSRDTVERDNRRPSRDTSDPPHSPDERREAIPSFSVKLEDQWFRSQIEVRRGQHVRVEASGTIYLEGQTATGPEGLRGQNDK